MSHKKLLKKLRSPSSISSEEWIAIGKIAGTIGLFITLISQIVGLQQSQKELKKSQSQFETSQEKIQTYFWGKNYQKWPDKKPTSDK